MNPKAGGLTSTWRDHILQHFKEPVHRLTLVADPDGLMLEEQLLAAIRQRGFDLLTFDDPVTFRYAYESGYRQRWDAGEETDLVVILRSPEADLRALAYDLLQSGRSLTFSLPALFPKLSYPMLQDLDLARLQRLYDAYRAYTGPEMGDRASAWFVLRHAFGIVPDLIRTPADLLKLLLSRYVRGERLPPRLDAVLLDALRQEPAFDAWPLARFLANRADFFAFLQRAWYGFVASRQPEDVVADAVARDVGPGYAADVTVPFDDPDVRAYVDTLFLEGDLKPVELPQDWRIDGWAQIGVTLDEDAFARRRFTGLLDHLAETLASSDGTHRDWLAIAERWAELVVLRYRLQNNPGDEHLARYRRLHLDLERAFAAWMMARYHTLHSLPFLPRPVMVHHVPNYLASRQARRDRSRVALVVVDGLALDQWLIIRESWLAEGLPWTWEEDALFAWVPTLTPISRQATFAGTQPQFFPTSWQTTTQEPAHWQRFWREQGLRSGNVGCARNLGVKELNLDPAASPDVETFLERDVLAIIDNPQVTVAGLVVNTVDNVMHGMQLGTAGMHQQIKLWMHRYRYLTELVSRLLHAGFGVYLTSDHGNVWAHGMGRPKEGILAETRGERARLYTDPAFLDLAQQQLPEAVAWSNVGLPAELSVLLAPELKAFVPEGTDTVCHGGMALEEVIVPFIHIAQAAP
jgi:hypothetical protein